MPLVETRQPIPPEAIMPQEQPEAALELPETRVEVDLGGYNPSAEAVKNNWELLGNLPARENEDVKLELIKSLGISNADMASRAAAAKEKGDDPVQPDDSEFKKIRHIFVLRKMLLGHDWRAEDVANEARIYISQKRKKIAQDILGLQSRQPRTETITATIQKLKTKFDELTSDRANLDKTIAAGYPKLWEKIKPPEAPTPIEPEPEQVESMPEQPEFLTAEAWQAIYEMGLNYLETEKTNLDPKKKKETSGYFYIDPTNPNLSQELRDMAVDQDEILAKLDKGLKTSRSFDVRERINKEINRRRKETSWDEAMLGMRKTLGDELNDKIRHNEALATGDKIAIKDLLKPPIMQYPTEAEARAILEDLKAKEPDRAVAMYAQSEDGRPLKIFIHKTNKEIEVSENMSTHLRPDYGQETKLIALIGSRINAKKLSELKNKLWQ